MTLVARGWADLADSYLPLAVNPTLGPAFHIARPSAKKAFELAALGSFLNESDPVRWQRGIAAGFVAYSAILAASAAPYTAVPPAPPLVLPLVPPTADVVVVANAFATAIKLWLSLGVASILPAPPLPWVFI